MTELPWSGPWIWSPRCKARKAPVKGGYYGRCELVPHRDHMAHALERGMINVRWTDGEVTIESTDMEQLVVAQALDRRREEALIQEAMSLAERRIKNDAATPTEIIKFLNFGKPSTNWRSRGSEPCGGCGADFYKWCEPDCTWIDPMDYR